MKYKQVAGGSQKGKIYARTPEKCDICKGEFNGTMFDVAVPMCGGSWGNICNSCFDHTGARIGIGFGQEYRAVEE